MWIKYVICLVNVVLCDTRDYICILWMCLRVVSSVLHLTSCIFLHRAPRSALSKNKIIIFIFSIAATLQLLFQIPDSTFVSQLAGQFSTYTDMPSRNIVQNMFLFPLLGNRTHFRYEPISPNCCRVTCAARAEWENGKIIIIELMTVTQITWNDMLHAIFT